MHSVLVPRRVSSLRMLFTDRYFSRCLENFYCTAQLWLSRQVATPDFGGVIIDDAARCRLLRGAKRETMEKLLMCAPSPGGPRYRGFIEISQKLVFPAALDQKGILTVVFPDVEDVDLMGHFVRSAQNMAPRIQCLYLQTPQKTFRYMISTIDRAPGDFARSLTLPSFASRSLKPSPVSKEYGAHLTPSQPIVS